MKTNSVMIQSLCVPCFCRCRYCLLSWDGKTAGATWERSIKLAERYIAEIKEARPDVGCFFSFGYSMEHPDLSEAIRALRRLGSPTASFLQCDGMKMRDGKECKELVTMLSEEGIKHLNFTVYGLQAYHDRFAGRKGDFELIFRMMNAAEEKGMVFSAGIPLTAENCGMADELVSMLRETGCAKVSLFVPHEEGRGVNLCSIRLRKGDLNALSEDTLKLFNFSLFRTEEEWIRDPAPAYENRSILISLTKDNIYEYEKRSAVSVLNEIEKLDDSYYAAFPSFGELADIYGDPEGDRIYRFRDLWYHYRRLYAEEHGVEIYDVTDERQSGSRRY